MKIYFIDTTRTRDILTLSMIESSSHAYIYITDVNYKTVLCQIPFEIFTKCKVVFVPVYEKYKISVKKVLTDKLLKDIKNSKFKDDDELFIIGSKVKYKQLISKIRNSYNINIHLFKAGEVDYEKTVKETCDIDNFKIFMDKELMEPWI